MKNELVNQRLIKANLTLKEAKVLFGQELFNGAVNRYYYACFYLVSSLLAKIGVDAHTHNGVKTKFFLHFLKTEKVSQDLGKIYSNLMNERQEGDYDDFMVYSFQVAESI